MANANSTAAAVETAVEVLGDDLRVTRITPRLTGAGTWVRGTVAGHEFEALVFPGHADEPEYELSDSRISKLWVRRLADGMLAFHFDRGLDRQAVDATAAAVVDFLAAGQAEHVFGH